MSPSDICRRGSSSVAHRRTAISKLRAPVDLRIAAWWTGIPGHCSHQKHRSLIRVTSPTALRNRLFRRLLRLEPLGTTMCLTIVALNHEAGLSSIYEAAGKSHYNHSAGLSSEEVITDVGNSFIEQDVIEELQPDKPSLTKQRLAFAFKRGDSPNIVASPSIHLRSCCRCTCAMDPMVFLLTPFNAVC